ncbi:MAG: hypothetical protein M3Q96_05355 [Pseudomonadota bacterium]|nr:hypothetical protein [Pseudomonadota bacterium]
MTTILRIASGGIVMKMRLLLLVLAIAALISGCVTSAGYGSSYRGQRVGVGVTYSQGAPYGYGARSGGYGYYGGYAGGYAPDPYYRDGYYRDPYYRDGYYRPGYGYYGRGDSRPGYGRYPYGNYPGNPYSRGYHPGSHYYPGIHPGNRYYGQPYPRPIYRGHNNYPRITPPRIGGRPPWRHVAPPSIPRVQPPVVPGNNPAPLVETPPEGGIERDLRRYKGSEIPVD